MHFDLNPLQFDSHATFRLKCSWFSSKNGFSIQLKLILIKVLFEAILISHNEPQVLPRPL